MVLHVTSGLASRCFCIYQAICLCKAHDDKLIIIWPVSEDCAISFWDVFSRTMCKKMSVKIFDMYEMHKSCRQLLKRGRFCEVLSELKHRLINKSIYKRFSPLEFINYYPPASVGWEGESYRNWVRECREKFLTLYNNKSKVYLKVYSSIVDSNSLGEAMPKISDVIKFKECYSSIVNEIFKYGEGNDYIGVHIRRTDNDVCIEKSKTPYFTEKIKGILNLDNSTLFFLATDDLEEERLLKKLFGSSIITFDNKSFGRNSNSGMVSGIIDLLCLAHCNYILGSFGSVFSNFAAQYGNIDLFVADNTESEGWKKTYAARF